jgi:hypothetical protein
VHLFPVLNAHLAGVGTKKHEDLVKLCSNIPLCDNISLCDEDSADQRNYECDRLLFSEQPVETDKLSFVLRGVPHILWEH